MSNILPIGPTTKGHPTNSADIQEALDKVGEGRVYDAVHFAAGTYLIDDSIKKNNRYSVLAINNGSEIYGDMDKDGKITTIFKLMNHAPLIPFACGLPILGPASNPGTNIKIYNIEFDGNNKVNEGPKTQKPSTDAECYKDAGKQGYNYGKGFHNFIGTHQSSFKNCSFYNIYVHDTAGDGFRTYYNSRHPEYYKPDRSDMNCNIELYNWTVVNCGHCALMLEYAKDSQIHDCKIKARSNGAVRTQNKCSNITINNIFVDGTEYNYNPGMQITGDKISITNCTIFNTYGPGIEVQGEKYFDVNNNKEKVQEIYIANNTFIKCGIYPDETKDPKEQIKYWGVGGVIANGANVIIEQNVFSGCRGYAIAANIYYPDGSNYDKNSSYNIFARNNIILYTKEALNPGDKESGAAIANLLINEGHKVIARRNTFYNNLKDLQKNVSESPAFEAPNIGFSNTESSNTGSSNTGSSNTGPSNTGSSNTGSSNTGPSNTGSSNTGPSNTGSLNTGSSTGESSIPEEEIDIITSFKETAIVIPLNSEDKRKSVLNNLIDITLEEGKDYIIIHRK